MFSSRGSFSNTSSIDKYNEIVEKQNKPPVSHAHKVTKAEMKEEMVMLSLRTIDGVNVDQYKQEFGENILETKNKQLVSLVKNGFLIIDKNNNIKCTDKGYLVLNRIILELV